MDWKDRAKELRESGLDWLSVTLKVLEEYPNEKISYEKVKRLGYNAKGNKGQKLKENYIPNTYKIKNENNRTTTFAIVSDTHINSKYSQLTHLHAFYDLCEKRGIKQVFHCGDIDDGHNMRQGHIYECYRTGVSEHLDEIVKNYPRRNGITTYLITGNHDASSFKQCGLVLGESIADKRDDIVFLGSDNATIELPYGLKLQLRHPWDGTNYAISLKVQKMVDNMKEKDKPDILAVGHYHKVGHFAYRGVQCILPGCFQGDTPFSKGKNLIVQMGAYIITVTVDKEGNITSFIPELIPFENAVEEDYKNWI